MKKFILVSGIFAAISLMLAPMAFAAEFIQADKDSGNVTLSATETHHNAYVAGSSVFINSNTTGDLYAAGGTLTVEGSVEQDLVIAGGTISINGPVGGDIRMAGGNLTINNSVKGDVLVAGGSVRLTENSSVGGDLVVAGGQVIIDGPVTGNVRINGGSVTINNKMDGLVKVVAGQDFILGSKAEVANTISYKGQNDAQIAEGAQITKIDFEKVTPPAGGQAGHAIAAIFTIIFIIKVIGLILAGLLLMKLFPRSSQEVLARMHDNIWINLGIGAIGLIVVPFVSIILFITFIGFYIGIIAMLLWVLMLVLAVIVAAVYIGSWIIKLLTKKTSLTYDWQALVIGMVVVGVITVIPIIGPLALFILLLMAFGALIREKYSRIKSEQQQLNF